MKNESGRSLVEMLGVMAIGTLMSVAAVGTYQVVRDRQARAVAAEDIKSLAENTRIIYSGRKNYAGITKGYLIKTGALKTEKIMGRDFEISAPEDGKRFSVVFEDFDAGDCAYFATKKFDWAAAVSVNGFLADPASRCMELNPNRVEFIME
ncbi:MAG: type II secretion system GspH family protein [Rickettsiales bacterium]|jgi:type II secretory pathway pseudopilin PulG|nr:type II secretion system GspH family protein [Rickettsiales bacterium]